MTHIYCVCSTHQGHFSSCCGRGSDGNMKLILHILHVIKFFVSDPGNLFFFSASFHESGRLICRSGKISDPSHFLRKRVLSLGIINYFDVVIAVDILVFILQLLFFFNLIGNSHFNKVLWVSAREIPQKIL